MFLIITYLIELLVYGLKDQFYKFIFGIKLRVIIGNCNVKFNASDWLIIDLCTMSAQITRSGLQIYLSAIGAIQFT